jgi:hypothetical protein
LQHAGFDGAVGWRLPGYEPHQMSKGEWIIQLVKIALGVLIAGYFLWWSLEVLKRLPSAG